MKKILHLIDAVGPGGAESLLLNTVNELSDYDNYVIYLHGPHQLKKEFKAAKVVCLNKKEKDFASIVPYLRKFIISNKIDIVHAHSYWTNIWSRLATPRKVKLVNSFHFADYDTKRNSRVVKMMKFIDLATYRKGIILVAVSEYIAAILKELHGEKPGIVALPNFIDDVFYQSVPRIKPWDKKELKVIAIGHAKLEKNYELLIEAVDQSGRRDLVVDIFGGGELKAKYEEEVARRKLDNIHFKGVSFSIHEFMNQYDLYLMCSKSEACPLSPIQAMSAGLPLLLSDIPALQEMAKDRAIYFKSGHPEALADRLKGVLQGDLPLVYGTSQYKDILQHYSKQDYLASLRKLYES
jgi:glycosyltransferase involved in cell wall biosynthesis